VGVVIAPGLGVAGWSLLVVAALAGAAPAVPAAPASGTAAAKSPSSGAARPRRSPLTVSVDPDPARLVEDSVGRAEAEAVFAQGPHAVVAALAVEPAFERKRFVGFRILRVASRSPFAGRDGVRPGDVVMRVNGEPLERPDQFMRAWEVARAAAVIEVRLRRAGEDLRMRWRLDP
jgi:type II secretory pathway component PulC